MSTFYHVFIMLALLSLLLYNMIVLNEISQTSLSSERSNGKGLTQRAFLPQLRTAPQRSRHPAPPAQYCNCLHKMTHNTN